MAAGAVTVLLAVLVVVGVVGGSSVRVLPAVELSSAGGQTGATPGDSAQERTGTEDATVSPTSVITDQAAAGNAETGMHESQEERETVVGPVRYQGGPRAGGQEERVQDGAQGGSK